MQSTPNIELTKLSPKELREKFIEFINGLEIQGFFVTAKAFKREFKKEIEKTKS